MFALNFKHVSIESYGLHLPKEQVTTAEIEDKLAPLYKKYLIPFGTLEKLSGIQSRGLFSKEETPSAISTIAGTQALENIGFDKEKIGAVFNCSVTRDYFEPATSVIVHKNLGFPETTMAMDITNACVGFSNGMLMAAHMIETGVIKAALLVSGENLCDIFHTTLAKLANPDLKMTRSEFAKTLPTFTLGSGAVAMVLCHDSIATSGHKLVNMTSRSASQHKDLCVGNGDFCFLQEDGLNPLMETESKKLISNAAKLGGRTWADFSESTSWSKEEIDHVFCHQVGKQVNSEFYKTVGLNFEKDRTVYETYGNMVSAAMPSSIITKAQEGLLKTGEKIVCMGYGSGLNSIFSGIIW